MPYGLKVLTPPSAEPVSVADAKIHCRISTLNTVEDDLVAGLITSAREQIERVSDRALASKRLLLTLDRFPGYGCSNYFYNNWQGYCDHVLRLPRAPVQAVESVKYLDLNGIQQTVDPAIYRVDTTTDPGRLTLALNKSWPQALYETKSIEITYVAGFGPVTTGTAAAIGTQTVTPASMLGIYAGTVLGCDVGTSLEYVTVESVASTTFTATFTKSHPSSFAINAVPKGYQSAMKLLLYDWYWTRGDTPTLGATGMTMPNGVTALLSGLAHGEIF